MSRTIGIAVATYERAELTLAAFSAVQDDPRVSHVAISDDASSFDVYQRLGVARFFPRVQVTLDRNEQNLGSWSNKRRAVELSKAEWVALIDSDNVVGPDYLDALLALPTWNPNVLYLPVRGVPVLNYEKYSGVLFDRNNVASYLDDPLFQMSLNTGNFFVHRETHLMVTDSTPEESYASDGIYFVYRWLAAGLGVFITPNLSYAHLVHNGHWMKTAAQSTAFANELIRRMFQNVWEAPCS